MSSLPAANARFFNSFISSPCPPETGAGIQGPCLANQPDSFLDACMYSDVQDGRYDAALLALLEQLHVSVAGAGYQEDAGATRKLAGKPLAALPWSHSGHTNCCNGCHQAR